MVLVVLVVRPLRVLRYCAYLVFVLLSFDVESANAIEDGSAAADIVECRCSMSYLGHASIQTNDAIYR